MKIFNTILVCIFLFISGYTVFYGSLDLLSSPINLNVISISSKVKAGDYLNIQWNVNKNWSNCEIEIHRFLRSENGDEILLSSDRSLDEKNDEYDINLNILIPEDLPSGFYEYYSKSYFTCNALHRLFGPYVYTTIPIKIEVLPKGKNSQTIDKKQTKHIIRKNEDFLTKVFKTLTKPFN